MRVRHGESREDTSARQNPGHAAQDREGGALDRTTAELRHPESGQTTVVMILFLGTFLFGFIALGIDMQTLFRAKRQVQGAADAAAVAAAVEAPDIPSEKAAAAAVAKMNGFDNGLAVNPAIVTVNQIPTSGNYVTANPGTYIEVVVSQPIKTFFAGIITHKATMLVAARAVGATVTPPASCVCLEGTTGTTLNLSNNAKMNPGGCGTTVNSNAQSSITVTGGSVLGGLSIGSRSPNWHSWNNGANYNQNGASIAAGTTWVEGIPASCSPAAPTPPPPSEYTAANCMDDPSLPGTTPHIPWNGYSFPIGPTSTYSKPQANNADGTGVVCYTSLTVGANGNNETLLPGIYIIKDGTLNFASNGNQGGAGVLIYLVGTAKLTIDNGANVNLSAMTSGAYNGVVVLQDPGNSNPISIQGGANMKLSGTIFAPTSAVTMGNGSNATVDASLIAQSLTMMGGTTLNSKPITGLGAVVSTTAKLVE